MHLICAVLHKDRSCLEVTVRDGALYRKVDLVWGEGQPLPEGWWGMVQAEVQFQRQAAKDPQAVLNGFRVR